MSAQKAGDHSRIVLISTVLTLFVIGLLPYSNLHAEDNLEPTTETLKDSKDWFRHYGDYLVSLTVQQASPRGFTLSVFSDTTFFETAIGKRLRIGSPGERFHWGILSDAGTTSLPFTIGVFYQWGQDPRGQYYLKDRSIFGFRLNIVY